MPLPEWSIRDEARFAIGIMFIVVLALFGLLCLCVGDYMRAISAFIVVGIAAIMFYFGNKYVRKPAIELLEAQE